MPAEVTMPQLSDTMTEGTVVKWNKKEGDKVRAGEELAEVETDKATMPMEAFDDGTLAVIRVRAGEKIAVGGLLAIIATAGESLDQVRANAGGPTAAAAPPAVPAASTGKPPAPGEMAAPAPSVAPRSPAPPGSTNTN